MDHVYDPHSRSNESVLLGQSLAHAMNDKYYYCYYYYYFYYSVSGQKAQLTFCCCSSAVIFIVYFCCVVHDFCYVLLEKMYKRVCINMYIVNRYLRIFIHWQMRILWPPLCFYMCWLFCQLHWACRSIFFCSPIIRDCIPVVCVFLHTLLIIYYLFSCLLVL